MSLTQQKLIHIKIEAFGAIERQIPADLNLQCESEIHVSEVLNQLLSLYPDIQPMLERCACATVSYTHLTLPTICSV